MAFICADKFPLQCCSVTQDFEFLRSVTVSCLSRTLKEADEHTKKQMPVCDPTRTEKSLDSGHEELDVLSSQEEMFPENNAIGNNRHAEPKCPSQRLS